MAAASDLPHAVCVELARAAVADGAQAYAEPAAVERALQFRRTLLSPVINATGVLLHTNLGRAPLAFAHPPQAINVEFDLSSGERGSRQQAVGGLLATLCAAEAAMVVNNGAAAVLLVLAALADGRQVLVSRGESVEIGGGFRVPEIMSESGCRLVEVGTTNRTRASDYEHAVGPDTALVLKVHASNYRMVGFTEAAPVEELTGLGVPVMVDAGSGLLDEQTPWLATRPAWLRDEPGIRQAIAAGAGLVTFSGDKLLGGPQAGIIVGRADLVATVARHPLARATRAGKLTLAALQAVALAYVSGDGAAIPLWRMAATPVDELRLRAERIAAAVPGAKVLDTEAVAGGGSLPGLTIPSVGVGVEVADADAESARLRGEAIVARVADGLVLCDLRTVDPADDDVLVAALLAR